MSICCLATQSNKLTVSFLGAKLLHFCIEITMKILSYFRFGKWEKRGPSKKVVREHFGRTFRIPTTIQACNYDHGAKIRCARNMCPYDRQYMYHEHTRNLSSLWWWTCTTCKACENAVEQLKCGQPYSIFIEWYRLNEICFKQIFFPHSNLT